MSYRPIAGAPIKKKGALSSGARVFPPQLYRPKLRQDKPLLSSETLGAGILQVCMVERS